MPPKRKRGPSRKATKWVARKRPKVAPPEEKRALAYEKFLWPRFKQSIVKPRSFENFKNSYGIDKGSDAGGICHFFFRINDCYDAFVTGAANTQPIGYDMICPDLYEKYRVYKGFYRGYIELLSTAAANCVLIMWVSRNTTAPASGRSAAGQPGAVVLYMSNDVDSTKNSTSFKGKFNVQDFIPKDELSWSAYNASPTNALALNFYICETDLTVLPSSVSVCKIYCELFQDTEVGMKSSNVIPSS